MSNLKTVDRASDLKSLKSELNNLAKEVDEYEKQLDDVKRGIDKVFRKLESLHGNSDKGGDITEKAIRNTEKLKEQRDVLIEKRDSLMDALNERGSEAENSAITQGIVTELENINRDIADLDVKITKTYNHLNNLSELLESEKALTGKLADSKASLAETGRRISKVKRLGLKKIGDKVIGGAASYATGTVKSGLKSGINKIDPLSGGINKDDVTDTGAESIRLARQSFGKVTGGIRTTKQAVKTTTRGIKTAAKVTKQTAKGAYKAAVLAKNAIGAVGKFTVSAVTHIAAAMMNPVFWIIVAVLLIVAMLSSAVVLIMGGTSNQKAAMAAGAVGLGNVSEAYTQGVEMRETAIDNAKSGHNALIDAAGSDDLIYMSVTKADGSVVNYSTAFAESWQKDFLKSAPWTYPLNENLLNVNDTISIAYILLQKRANEANGTTNQIYDVTFTQEIFDEVIGASVVYNSTVYPNQTCPGQNCDYWIDDDGGIHYYCHGHNLYAIGVWYYTPDTVMNSLGFTAYEKQWTELTKAGFESNPNITG